MKSIFNIDYINVMIYRWDNGFDIEIDDGRLSIIISTPLSFYGKLHVRCTKQKCTQRSEEKFFYKKGHNVPKT